MLYICNIKTKQLNIMKLSEKFKESLIYLFLLCVVAFMLLGCNERRETEDEKQERFFKEEIQKRKLNKLY